jgi:ferredoxin-NADP reductase
VWWLHGARNAGERAFGAEVDGLLAALRRTHRLDALSRPGPDDAVGADFDLAGRLSPDTLVAAGAPADADYYLCGPEAFMRSLSAGIVARGTPPEQVAMELFGAAAPASAPGLDGEHPPPHPPSGPTGAGPEVTFSRSGLSVEWDPGFGSLLELAEACDVPVGFGCRNGVCHACVSGLLAGEIDYATEPLQRPDDEHVLVCCARPRSPIVLEL